MSTPFRLSAACLLLAALGGCQPPQRIQASYHCEDQIRFSFDRRTQTVEVFRGGERFKGYMDEKGLLTWPKPLAGKSLPDSFYISRKTPDQMKLYGGFAGTGKACRLDPG
ncbi:hypothetical protein [Chromobacterium violaceum]|uniref:hypothetical protein n=1 Tax=Chromobacterium violaceum TaxID=536 RepID=UPI0002DDEB7F|nr:hypothetical protein [Chromobacterium violaceum]KJH66343.1 hypothetical protein UF16_16545 [Chromobacterium violaceum]KMN49003.1 hypothetical protein VK93_12230 [Chromobacterium violaceum]KMN85152.1 hypothetical protein VL02_16105 [Chromobacterium violaceum]KMN91722.1 hypothetical protein VL04_03265 [Chromobacterium violaceum]KMO02920.1 hypothetical protein VL16_16040 [Chromobacterium violaceum]